MVCGGVVEFGSSFVWVKPGGSGVGGGGVYVDHGLGDQGLAQCWHGGFG